MKILLKPTILLAVIICVGFFLRGYQLGLVPQSLNWDEVSLGYNAYSILNTGKDEYGEFMPLVLRSFDDYKPALYTYLVIPFVALLGLTEQAVRLPSAIAGTLAVGLIYFLVLELLGSKKINIFGREIKSIHIALLASFFLAISPWHIQFSRIAYESNVGLTINIAVFLTFLKGLKKPIYLPLSFLLASLNIHMYQSDRVFSPLLVVVLCIIFYKKILKIKKWFVVSFFIAFLVSLPLIIFIATNNDALLRARGVSVFSEQSLVKRSSSKLLYDTESNNILGKIFDNRRVEFIKASVDGYTSHFDLNWLFITGDLARHHAPNMGLLHLFTLPFLLIGIYVMVFLNLELTKKLSFFSYFLLVPIPASITSGVPHAVRTLNFEWTFEFFIALGLVGFAVLILKIKKSIFKSVIYLGVIIYFVLSLVNISYYINQYFVQLNYFNARDWLYGYKEAIAYVSARSSDYDWVVVENEVPFDQSYMFFLFYLKVDPAYYQSLGGTKSGGFKEQHKGFYNYTFEPVAKTEKTGKVLLMGAPNDIPAGLMDSKVISYPNGEPAIVISEK